MRNTKEKELNCLSWADDLLSTTKYGLQNEMDRTAEYYDSLGLTINQRKTKIIIFNKCVLKLSNVGDFFMNGSQIEITDEYQYLGNKTETIRKHAVSCN